MKGGVPQAVTNSAWAFAKLGYHAPKLFKLVNYQAKWIAKKGGAQEMSNAAWACAMVGYDAPDLLSALDENLDRFLSEEATSQVITNSCFAIAFAGKSKELESSLKRIWEKGIEMFEYDEHTFADHALCQLAQTYLFAKADGVDLPKIPEMITAKMKDVVHKLDGNTVSWAIRDISKVLSDLGVEHELEVSIDDDAIMPSCGLLTIDLACVERKLAIEFHGPLHFLKAPSSGSTTEITHEESGTTKAKRRVLEALGWTVVTLDYREFQNENREKYLQPCLINEKLRTLGIRVVV